MFLTFIFSITSLFFIVIEGQRKHCAFTITTTGYSKFHPKEPKWKGFV